MNSHGGTAMRSITYRIRERLARGTVAGLLRRRMLRDRLATIAP